MTCQKYKYFVYNQRGKTMKHSSLLNVYYVVVSMAATFRFDSQ